MNKCVVIGNLTRDPELRTANTTSGQVSVCNFSVAVNRRGGKETDFFKVTAWRGLAENCSRYLSKGRKVCVVGPVSLNSYQASDGSTKASLEINAEEIEFLSPSESKPESRPKQDPVYDDLPY